MKTFQTYLTEGPLKSKDMDARNDYRERLVKMIDTKKDIMLQKGGEVKLTYINDEVENVLRDPAKAQTISLQEAAV